MSSTGTPLRHKLLLAVSDPEIKFLFQALLDYCEQTIADREAMEQTIFDGHQESGKELAQMEDAAAVLGSVAQRALVGARRLDAFLLDEPAVQRASKRPDIVEGLSAESVPHLPDVCPENEFDDDEIVSVVEFMKVGGESLTEEVHALVFGHIAVFSANLQNLLLSFDEGFDRALRSKKFSTALRDLDEVCNAINDRVMLLMEVVYTAFLGSCPPEKIFPGHKKTLEQALMIRREVANLRRRVNVCNRYVLDAETPRAHRVKAYTKMIQLLGHFVHSKFFPSMRAQDRLFIRKFYKNLEGRSMSETQKVCAKCAKYLNTLVAINRRSVLVRHDTELLEEISELVESAKSLSSTSPRSAAQLVRDAWSDAEALFGRNDELDKALALWKSKPPRLDKTEDVVAAADRLAAFC